MAIKVGSDSLAAGIDETAAARAAACLFRGMGDASRVAILRHLLLGEHKVADLTAHLGLAQSTVSKHLACLRDCGLLDMRPVARQSYYRLAHDVRELLMSAESLLGRIGHEVSLCPTVVAVAGPAAAAPQAQP